MFPTAAAANPRIAPRAPVRLTERRRSPWAQLSPWGIVPRYFALLGSCRPPEAVRGARASWTSTVLRHLTRLLRRISPFSALTMRGVVVDPVRLGSVIGVPSGMENDGTSLAPLVLQSSMLVSVGLTQDPEMPWRFGD
jgi:hypothetical protein